MDTQKLSLKENFGHSFGIFGSSIIYAFLNTFLMKYYTDVIEITPAVIGTLFFIARIWDAINDPIMGLVVDKTNTRWGKFRPYVLITPIFIVISTILLFTVPDISMTGQIIYAYITYIIWGMVFTINDIPIWGLSSAVTKNIKERKKHVSFLTVFQMIGNALPGIVGASLLIMFGGENIGTSYTKLAALVAIIGGIGFIVAFFTTKERVEITPQKENKGFLQIFKAAFSNKVMIVFVIFMLFNTSFGAIYATINIYFAQYVLNDVKLLGLLMFMLVLGQILGTIVGPLISFKIGNKKTLICNFILYASLFTVYYFIGYESIVIVSIFTMIGGFLMGIPGVLMTAMLSDIGEYVHWRYGVKAEGVIFSTKTFGTKLSAGFVAFLVSITLTLVNYVPNVTQTASATNGIFAIVTFLPVLFSIGSLIPLFFYNLTEEYSVSIRDELEKRGDGTGA